MYRGKRKAAVTFVAVVTKIIAVCAFLDYLPSHDILFQRRRFYARERVALQISVLPGKEFNTRLLFNHGARSVWELRVRGSVAVSVAVR